MLNNAASRRSLAKPRREICQKFAPWVEGDMATKLVPMYRIATIANDWFESLPERVKSNIFKKAQRREMPENQRLYSRGDTADGIYCVIKGCIRVSGVSGDGHESVLDFYGPRTWFGEVAMLDDSLRAQDAVAATRSLLLQITPDVFEELLETHPPFARGLLRLEATRLRLLLAALEAYASQTLEQRLANRLLMLSLSFGVKAEAGIAIDLHLPQEVLAQLIGATRQRVNQILSKWTASKLISHQYGKVTLRNRDRLIKMAQM
jgi:CRP-like cAMP-binding protein